jgi:hypothetical protein
MSSDILEKYVTLTFRIEDKSNIFLQNFRIYLPDTTWYHIPENSNPYSHNYEYLRSFSTKVLSELLLQDISEPF